MPIDRPARIHPLRAGERAFLKGRAAALKRLASTGVPAPEAEAWVRAWDATTDGLVDFRRAADFWQLGYRYAREEYARGFAPPAIESGDAGPPPPHGARAEDVPAR